MLGVKERNMLTLIRAFSELPVVRGLLHEVQQTLGKSFIRDRPSYIETKQDVSMMESILDY